MEAGASRFSERYKATAGLSVEALRVKQARSRSRSQKENRDRQLRKSRRLEAPPLSLGPAAGGEQHGEAADPGHPKSLRTAAPPQLGRLEMLQRYKEEKLLRKLKAEREKPKQIFKVGIYRPDVVPFQPQNTVKPKAKGLVPSSYDLRVTRSMSKKQELLVTKAPSAPRFTAAAKAGPVKGNMTTSNRGGSTVATGTRSQQQTIQTAGPKVPAAREKRDVQASSVKPSQARSQAEPKTAPKALKPVHVTKPQTTNKAKKPGKSGEKSNCKLVALDEPEPAPCEEQEMEAIGKKDQPPSCEEPTPPTESDDGHQMPPVLGAGRVGKRVSFAPENYVFAPVAGLPQFKFPPLSPRSVNHFFAPCSWSPVEHTSKGNVVSSTTMNSRTRTRRSKFAPEIEPESLPEAKSEDTVSTVIEEVPVSNKPQDSLASSTADINGPVHDVAYFRGIVMSETESLSGLCQQWEGWANTAEIPDGVKDLVRTTVGQARLLVAERFKQFNGLVDNCEFKTSEKEVTCTDLEGFWDMVYFQVEDVNKKFEHLKKLQENNWEEQNELLSLPKKVVKKKVAIPKSTEGLVIKASKTPVAPKSSLAALKASMKAKLKQEMAGSSSKETQKDVIVFDAGFFRVESPAKCFTASPNTSMIHLASGQQPKEQYLPTKGVCNTAPTSPMPCIGNGPNQQTSERKASEILPETESPLTMKSSNNSKAGQSTAQEAVCSGMSPEEVNASPDFAKYLQPRSCDLPETPQSPFHDNGYDAKSMCTKRNSTRDVRKSELSSSPLEFEDVEMKSPVSEQPSPTGARPTPQEEMLQQTNSSGRALSSISATQGTPSFSSVNNLLIAGTTLHSVQSTGNCMSPFETMVGGEDRRVLPLQKALEDLISFSPSGTPQ
ncbi:disks large-associated protein 5 [Carcharodon carcharias]|uniref:disks large-associated protein 5 n=1 Tax=Carcharodon carcharias TaxID=13397 RepID=UPI001B7DB319|nr:disks large-associated protein 5 [Carcharodon carcharias]